MSNALDGLGVLYLMVIGYIAFVITFSVLFASFVIHYGKKHKFPNYAIVLAVIVGIIVSLFLPPIMVMIYKILRSFKRDIPRIVDKINLAITPKSSYIKKYKESIVILLNDYNNECNTKINQNPALQSELTNMSNKIAIIENELSIINNNVKELKALKELNKEETYNIMKLKEQYDNLDNQKNILNSQINEINNKMSNNSKFIQLKNYLNDFRNNSHLSLAEMTQIENEVSKTIYTTCAVSLFAL